MSRCCLILLIFTLPLWGACSWVMSPHRASQNNVVNWEEHPEMFPLALGPEAGLPSSATDNQVRTPVMALVFCPGVNHTLAYLAVLKILAQKKINFQMVAGMELGAWWAYWYAQQLSLGRMEWLFYQYLRRPLMMPFSSTWQQTLWKLWRPNNRQERIEQQKLVLILPVAKNGGIEYRRRGPLAAALQNNLKLNLGLEEKNLKNNEDEVPFIFHFAPALRQAGADLVFGLNVLPEDSVPRFQTDQDDQNLGQRYQIFAKGHIIGQKDFDLVLTLPVVGPLDNVDDALALMANYEQQAAEFAEQIKAQIILWQEKQRSTSTENTGIME